MAPQNDNDPVSLADFRELMFKRIVPVREMTDKKGNSFDKILSFWRRNDLLPFIESGRWIEVSFVQLMWIRILDDLRDISFPVEKMKVVCDYFFKDAYAGNLPKKNYQFNKTQIFKKKVAGTITEEEEHLLQFIEEALKNPPLLATLKLDINYLTNFIAATIACGEDGFIYIFFDGSVWEETGGGYVNHSTFEPDFMTPYIRLSISHYLKEFMNDEELSSLLMPQLLNEDEIKVLREMGRKNIKQITIHIADKNKPIRIESTTTGQLTKEQTKLMKEIFGLKNYESIVLDTIDEKTLSFKKTRKKI